jgi:DNA-binding MarR family transcriptional regulator
VLPELCVRPEDVDALHELLLAVETPQLLVSGSEPRRPRDIADALGCDPSQVSRALRELQANGSVVRSSAPRGAAGDRRAHWYARGQLDVLAA